jgi:hypothetical protein
LRGNSAYAAGEACQEDQGKMTPWKHSSPSSILGFDGDSTSHMHSVAVRWPTSQIRSVPHLAPQRKTYWLVINCA